MTDFKEWWAQAKGFVLADIEKWSIEDLMRFAYDSALPQWQPFETAPQDGTKFLLLGTSNEISFCRWHKEVGAWCHGGLIGPVDHECLWMPLPEAPQEGEE